MGNPTVAPYLSELLNLNFLLPVDGRGGLELYFQIRANTGPAWRVLLGSLTQLRKLSADFASWNADQLTPDWRSHYEPFASNWIASSGPISTLLALLPRRNPFSCQIGAGATAARITPCVNKRCRVLPIRLFRPLLSTFINAVKQLELLLPEICLSFFPSLLGVSRSSSWRQFTQTIPSP
jgi:hypothetical protein